MYLYYISNFKLFPVFELHIYIFNVLHYYKEVDILESLLKIKITFSSVFCWRSVGTEWSASFCMQNAQFINSQRKQKNLPQCNAEKQGHHKQISRNPFPVSLTHPTWDISMTLPRTHSRLDL